jgi:hypothetical protein
MLINAKHLFGENDNNQLAIVITGIWEYATILLSTFYIDVLFGSSLVSLTTFESTKKQ